MTGPTTILAFAPQHNKLGKHDATGAFQPEMQAFAKCWDQNGHRVRTVMLDNHKPALDVFLDVRAELARERNLHAVAFFMHGLRHQIPQIGWSIANAGDVAEQLRRAFLPDVGVVALYACDAARDLDRDGADDLEPGLGGEGGFADTLADALRARGWSGWIDAHAVAAHTTKNPYVRRFRGTNQGGTWIVEPPPTDAKSIAKLTKEHRERVTERWERWRRALRSRTSSLRFRFPLFQELTIEHELEAMPP